MKCSECGVGLVLGCVQGDLFRRGRHWAWAIPILLVFVSIVDAVGYVSLMVILADNGSLSARITASARQLPASLNDIRARHGGITLPTPQASVVLQSMPRERHALVIGVQDSFDVLLLSGCGATIATICFVMLVACRRSPATAKLCRMYDVLQCSGYALIVMATLLVIVRSVSILCTM